MSAEQRGSTEGQSAAGYGVRQKQNLREAAGDLRRPFTAAAVKFKVQATWPKDNPTGGLIVSYIDARLVVERLNLLVPDLWHDDYEPIGSGLMWCHLTVDGVTRKDVGEGQGKGLVSDAFKRAAVKFGIGVSLYAVPKMILNLSEGHVKPKRSREGMTLELTPNGEARVRDLYAAWLDTRGIQAFGDPLDHGDTEGAQGDIEADETPIASEGGSGERARLLNDLERARVLSAIADTEQNERLLFAAVGVSSPEELTVEHAKRIRALLDKTVGS